MKQKFQNKIFGNIKFTLSLIVFLIIIEKIMGAIGTTVFFGVDFQIIIWITIIIIVISLISDLKDVEWINKILSRF